MSNNAEFKTDALNYGSSDSGCPLASAFQGSPSSCLKCPFDECVYDGGKRVEEIKRLHDNGIKPREISHFYDVTERQIQRIVRV